MALCRLPEPASHPHAPHALYIDACAQTTACKFAAPRALSPAAAPVRTRACVHTHTSPSSRLSHSLSISSCARHICHICARQLTPCVSSCLQVLTSPTVRAQSSVLIELGRETAEHSQYLSLSPMDGWLEYASFRGGFGGFGGFGGWVQAFFVLSLGAGLQFLRQASAAGTPNLGEPLEAPIPIDRLRSGAELVAATDEVGHPFWMIDVPVVHGPPLRLRSRTEETLAGWLSAIDLYCAAPATFE